MLVKWNSFKDMLSFDRDFDRLFSWTWDKSNWSPDIDVHEDEEKITIDVEIPGVDPKNVDINIDKDILTIKGNKSLKNKRSKGNYYRYERTEGSFLRSFSLPNYVNSSNISASYDKGVLTITVPKKPSEYPKKIEINGSG